MSQWIVGRLEFSQNDYERRQAKNQLEVEPLRRLVSLGADSFIRGRGLVHNVSRYESAMT